ncbi:hypothetical protein [Nannocystis exedens]|uniref:hypothetical protein n=1 Tax=Nannocystis exedens TaxID=54 RepID=UPI000BBA07F6|nr:hypothetical protein [Nannocystis exedens]PCC66468.1 hypothetical protein NAEX_09056 [Nannocystis exedens]
MTRVLFAGELDFRVPQLVQDTIAPALGERLQPVLGGEAMEALGTLKDAWNLLTSGDGAAIATSVAGLIEAFTGWLRSSIEADSATERLNIAAAQEAFVGPVDARWMWRAPSGGPPASTARTKMGPGWPSSRVLAQWNKGAVYVFPTKRIYDCVRRSFRRTDATNVFDDGQPTLAWTAADEAIVKCISRSSEYWESRGCAYNPGERIQLSAGTWPYVHGVDVVAWSGVTAVKSALAAHYLALHTPSAVHVQTDSRPVQAIWERWQQLVLQRLPLLPPVGQQDNGVFRTSSNQVHVQGPDDQYFEIEYAGQKWSVRADVARHVTDSFVGFFELRKAVLRDWDLLAPSVQKAGKDSHDPVVKARSLGQAQPQGPNDGPVFGGSGKKPVKKRSSSRAGLALLGLGAAAAAGTGIYFATRDDKTKRRPTQLLPGDER